MVVMNDIYDQLLARQHIKDVFEILCETCSSIVDQKQFIDLAIDMYIDYSPSKKFVINYLLTIFSTYKDVSTKYNTELFKFFEIHIHDMTWNVNLLFYNRIKSEIIFEFMEFYMQHIPYSTETKSTYKYIFIVCSFYCYYDITDIRLINHGKKLIEKLPNEYDLHREILLFFVNVYYGNSNNLLSNYTKYAFDFICNCSNIYPRLVSKIFETLENVNTIPPEIFDISIQFLSENLQNKQIYSRMITFYRKRDDVYTLNYICNHSLTKKIIRDKFDNPIELYLITQLFSYFTSSTETDVPCEFYYKNIFLPILDKIDVICVNPRYILFSLSNILASACNYSFIDVEKICKYMYNIITIYKYLNRFLDDIYYIVYNMADNNVLHVCMKDPKFIDTLVYWIRNTMVESYFFYYSVLCIFKTISKHDELYYLFDSKLGKNVLELAQMEPRLHPVMEYMNCTLQQKCGRILYKNNKISYKELEELGVTLYLVA